MNPEQTGTKAAFRYRLEVPAGETATVELRLAEQPGLGQDFTAMMSARAREADEFYAGLTPAGASADEASSYVRRSPGCSGASSSSTTTCCAGSRATRPARHRRTSRWSGRNREWTHLNNMDVISMPDPWEYPWYAAWDLAFHCVALAHVDPEFAKSQLILLCREWYMHPNGQLPAYEWSFSDVNPPVHAWAALRVYEIAGDEDSSSSSAIFHKLLLNFTWWVNRKDASGNNLFEGGFLGLDNIGPFDRSSLPVGGRLEQSDGTAWMAMYCQNLLELALSLAGHDPTYEDLATKFFEHFALIANALNEKGLWDEEDGFYYDLLHTTGSTCRCARARSSASAACGRDDARPGDDGAPARLHGARRVVHGQPPRGALGRPAHGGRRARRLADALDRGRGAAAPDPPRRCSTRPSSSPTTACGRSRSSTRRTRSTSLSTASRRRSTTSRASRRAASSAATRTGAARSGSRSTTCSSTRSASTTATSATRFTVEFPTGSGCELNLAQVADELSARLTGIFLEGDDGRRPVFAGYELFQRDPAWHDLIPFHEYFHGDTGAGLGASHQTGWTGLVADLIIRRGRGKKQCGRAAARSRCEL